MEKKTVSIFILVLIISLCWINSIEIVESTNIDISMTDLGGLWTSDPYYEESRAYDINTNGVVAGISYTDSDNQHACFWSETGEILDLGGLWAPGSTGDSNAIGINDHGHVVGQSVTAEGPPHACLWMKNGDVIDLGGLWTNIPSNFENSWANSINNYGDIVGASGTDILTSFPGSYEVHASLWSNTEDNLYNILDLGGLWGPTSDVFKMSIAHDINDNKEVVGYSTTDSGFTHAFLWTESTGMQDLEGLWGSSFDGFSFAAGINNNQDVVGYSSTDLGEFHACLWTNNGEIIDLGGLWLPDSTSLKYSLANDINDNGEVVGYSTTDLGEFHACLWTEADAMIDLGKLSSFDASIAWAINEEGTIVGMSERVSSPLPVNHATLWSLSCTITATVNIDPDTLNLKSNGNWIIAYIELPTGYDVNNIAIDSIRLTIDTQDFSVDLEAPISIGDYDNDNIPDLMIKFDRTAILHFLEVPDQISEIGDGSLIEFQISGIIVGSPFIGTDWIKVILPGN
jgi:probable HAF family extracellular repeat protein